MHDNQRVSWTKVKREELVELNAKCILGSRVSYDKKLLEPSQVLSDFMSKKSEHEKKIRGPKLQSWAFDPFGNAS